ncbi:hypothetical protein ACFX2F_002769 [Malus domestica]
MLEVPISETFLVHVVMNSLPESYTQLKVSYNALQAKWDINELISICVGEEVRIKKERAESVNYVQSYNQNPKHGNHDTVRKDATRSTSSSKKVFKPNKPSIFKCFFCKKAGHMKKNCPKYKAWLAKQEVKKGLHNKENTK